MTEIVVVVSFCASLRSVPYCSSTICGSGSHNCHVDWTDNCGNLSAGAALYAVDKAYVPLDGDCARIAIHQVNTGRRLRASVPLKDGGRR